MYNYGRLAMFPCLLNLNLCVIIIRLLMLAKEGKVMGSIEEIRVYLMVLAVTFSISVVSFIVLIVNDIRFHRQDQKQFEILDKSAASLNSRHDRATVERDRMSTEHDHLSNQLSYEHDRLSKEHDRLSNQLSTKHDRLSKEHDQIKEKLNNIYTNQETEKAAREAYGKVIPEGDTFKHMADAIYMHSVQLQQEVNTLKNQIIQLENKNRDQKQQIIALKERLSQKQEKPTEPEETEKNEYDEILDNMDLSPDSHDEEEWER